MPKEDKLIMVMTAHIPLEGVVHFKAYEEAVLPLLKQHGGKIERRLSNGDGTVEVHILSFVNKQGFENYCYDPKRLEHTQLFEDSGAQTELRQMMDVEI